MALAFSAPGKCPTQPDNQFRTWMDPTKYQTVTKAQGGGSAAIWALEYDQNTQPNVQAVKVEIAANVYYMVTVRRRVREDDLNDGRWCVGWRCGKWRTGHLAPS